MNHASVTVAVVSSGPCTNSTPSGEIRAVHGDGRGTVRSCAANNPACADGPGVPDGMKLDSRGNIWTSAPGGIRIITPEGKILAQFELPEVAANLAWGGPDGRTLYITARTSIYRVHTLVGGNMPVYRK